MACPTTLRPASQFCNAFPDILHYIGIPNVDNLHIQLCGEAIGCFMSIDNPPPYVGTPAKSSGRGRWLRAHPDLQNRNARGTITDLQSSNSQLVPYEINYLLAPCWYNNGGECFDEMTCDCYPQTPGSPEEGSLTCRDGTSIGQKLVGKHVDEFFFGGGGVSSGLWQSNRNAGLNIRGWHHARTVREKGTLTIREVAGRLGMTMFMHTTGAALNPFATCLSQRYEGEDVCEFNLPNSIIFPTGQRGYVGSHIQNLFTIMHVRDLTCRLRVDNVANEREAASVDIKNLVLEFFRSGDFQQNIGHPFDQLDSHGQNKGAQIDHWSRFWTPVTEVTPINEQVHEVWSTQWGPVSKFVDIGWAFHNLPAARPNAGDSILFGLAENMVELQIFGRIGAKLDGTPGQFHYDMTVIGPSDDHDYGVGVLVGTIGCEDVMSQGMPYLIRMLFDQPGGAEASWEHNMRFVSPDGQSDESGLAAGHQANVILRPRGSSSADGSSCPLDGGMIQARLRYHTYYEEIPEAKDFQDHPVIAIFPDCYLRDSGCRVEATLHISAAHIDMSMIPAQTEPYSGSANPVRHIHARVQVHAQTSIRARLIDGGCLFERPWIPIVSEFTILNPGDAGYPDGAEAWDGPIVVRAQQQPLIGLQQDPIIYVDQLGRKFDPPDEVDWWGYLGKFSDPEHINIWDGYFGQGADDFCRKLRDTLASFTIPGWPYAADTYPQDRNKVFTGGLTVGFA